MTKEDAERLAKIKVELADYRRILDDRNYGHHKAEALRWEPLAQNIVTNTEFLLRLIALPDADSTGGMTSS
ncbi:MAG: hypothetical protein LiPW15_304 [Parcubacteria group bacterium LiPW_15]|nr:MAG: hypothetical protein LiPW15_304 [Parcubacteria group bacterium LiPW_15]